MDTTWSCCHQKLLGGLQLNVLMKHVYWNDIWGSPTIILKFQSEINTCKQLAFLGFVIFSSLWPSLCSSDTHDILIIITVLVSQLVYLVLFSPFLQFGFAFGLLSKSWVFLLTPLCTFPQNIPETVSLSLFCVVAYMCCCTSSTAFSSMVLIFSHVNSVALHN